MITNFQIFEKNWIPKNNPNWFYLVLRGSEKSFESLMRMEFIQLKGISDHHMIARSWFDIRDVFLIMRGSEVFKMNNVEPIEYFNPDSSSPTEANDYGYVSFTEDMDYHEDEHGGVPTDLRFVFDKKLMNKKYGLQRFDANKESELVYFDQTGHQSLDCESEELTDDICRYYGEEYELRIYNDIPISNAIRLEFETPPSKEIIDLCKEKNIELKEW